jgi:hypothetical protein
MTAHAHTRAPAVPILRPALWGVVVGVLQTMLPVGLFWLDAIVVHAVGIAFIAAIYVGFAVADGRPHVIAVECIVAAGFVVLAAVALTTSIWLIVVAFAAHGVKDFWQGRKQFVRNTRWWPPFCAAVDWVVAAILIALIVAGVDLG